MASRHDDAGGATVVFVTHTRFFGGSLVGLRAVLRNLPANIRRVLVAPSDGPALEAIRAEGLVEDFVAIPWGDREDRVGWWSALIASWRLLRWSSRHRRGIAAIHANGLADAVVAAPAAVITRIPLVVWVHEADAASRRARYAGPVIDRLSARTEWVTMTNAAAEVLVRSGCTGAERVRIVSAPIDPDTALAPRKLPNGVVRVGFLGTDTVRKGFDLLPSVITALGSEDVRFLIFARHHDGLSPDLERTWSELHDLPGGRVDFCGRQDDIRVAYAQCDIVFCPSRKESFCMVAAEAMLNGIPVVASDLPEVREVLGDGAAGLLFATGDADSAVEALRRLVRDGELRRRLGDSGRSLAGAFAPENVAERFVELYDISPPA